MTKATLPSLLILLGACAVKDSHIAHEAETRLMGMSEVDLESCLGVPDQHSSFGDMDILTYYATSTSNDSYSIPIIGGMSFGNGGYCHATFQLKDQHVTQILYSGEKNATGAPDAYCAPIVRTCVSAAAVAYRDGYACRACRITIQVRTRITGAPFLFIGGRGIRSRFQDQCHALHTSSRNVASFGLMLHRLAVRARSPMNLKTRFVVSPNGDK